MADIIHLPISVPACREQEDARFGILRSLVWISMELRQIQQRLVDTDLDDHEKLSAGRTILAAVERLHQIASTVERSLEGDRAPSRHSMSGSGCAVPDR